MPTVAIFPWGDVIEDFLDPIGLTVSDFVERMSGGWLFGYVAALHASGWRAVIVCVSKEPSSVVVQRLPRVNDTLVARVSSRSGAGFAERSAPWRAT